VLRRKEEKGVRERYRERRDREEKGKPPGNAKGAGEEKRRNTERTRSAGNDGRQEGE